MSENTIKKHDPETLGSHKRKRGTEANQVNLEINLEAPEPPSKKTLRKAKKKQSTKPRKNKPEPPRFKDADSLDQQATTNQTSGGKPRSEERSEFAIWIGNLPFSITKKDLELFFSRNSKSIASGAPLITRIHLPSAPPKHGVPQNKGFAYVDFKAADTLQDAISLSESLLGGRRVLIKNARDFQGRPNEDTPAEVAPSKRLFVGNLTFDTTAEALEKHFERCGPVTNVHVATFEDSGKCKGYAWVDFERIQSAQNAMRGYVVDDEDETGEHTSKENESPLKSTKKRPTDFGNRRIWVNRLGDRKLRLEFAEDPATRYNKRFGKERTEPKLNADEKLVESQPDLGLGTISQVSSKPKGHIQNGRASGKKGAMAASRYSQDVVEKLKGSITRSQGTKISLE